LQRRAAVVSARIHDRVIAQGEASFYGLDRQLAALQRRHPGFRVEFTGVPVVGTQCCRRVRHDFWLGLALASLALGTIAAAALRSTRTSPLVVAGLPTEPQARPKVSQAPETCRSDVSAGSGDPRRTRSLALGTIAAATLRSARMGLIAALGAFFPVPLAALPLAWLGRPLDFGALVVLMLCWGLGAVQTLYLLGRFRPELALDADAGAPVARTTAGTTGGPMTAALVLLAGLFPATFSGITAVSQFAALACLGLVAAFLGATLLVPSLLRLGFSGPMTRERISVSRLMVLGFISVFYHGGGVG